MDASSAADPAGANAPKVPESETPAAGEQPSVTGRFTDARNRGHKRRRGPFRKAISREAGYIIIRALHAIISRLPLPVGRGLARVLGFLGYFALPRERRSALLNLTRVYGAEKSAREIRLMARKVFQNMVLTFIEWPILRRWPREKLLARFPNVGPDLQRMQRDIQATGTGAVTITGHHGNWELMALFFSQYMPGFLFPIAKRLYFDKYQDFLHRLRESSGVKVIYTDQSARRIIRVIRDGNIPGFLPDQDLRTNSGVFVDFFGLPAYTVTFPIDLARGLGVKYGVICLVREGKGYRVLYNGLFDVPKTEDKAADILTGSQAWSRVLEGMIRQYPEQWSWTHQRWRTVPGHPRQRHDRHPVSEMPLPEGSALQERAND